MFVHFDHIWLHIASSRCHPSAPPRPAGRGTTRRIAGGKRSGRKSRSASCRWRLFPASLLHQFSAAWSPHSPRAVLCCVFFFVVVFFGIFRKAQYQRDQERLEAEWRRAQRDATGELREETEVPGASLRERGIITVAKTYRKMITGISLKELKTKLWSTDESKLKVGL